MGLFGLFGTKGTPVDDETVVKRLSASCRDFDGIARDGEGHPVDVFECGEVAVTEMGKTRVMRLCRCRDTVDAACVRLKKKQAELFYITPLPFSLEFGWRNGGRVKMTAKFDRTAASSLPEWLQANVKTPGENVTAYSLGKLLDGRFSSDNPPEWLVVADHEDVAEPEAPSEPNLSADTELKPGAMVFGHYRIERELGSGGQGQVFLATDTQTVVEAHRQVVLKVLRCENGNDETSLHEFIREANTLSELRNDRIAACYWCKLLGNVPILAMEYIDGESLDKFLAARENGKIDETTARELLLPIAEALDFAHERGIYHRDVKPQNIIVRKVPKYGVRTCLLDFGIASREQTGGPQTSFRSIRGTLQYMAPEQQLVGRKPSASMDIYSLAVTAYECLTGTMPYPDGWQREAKVPPLASDTPFARAVMLGLAMLPEHRPATCRAVIDPSHGIQDSWPSSSSVASLLELQRPIMVYRQLLSQSAGRCEKDRPDVASWLRERQACLRDLSADLAHADETALVRFFEDVTSYLRAAACHPEDIFLAQDRLVELRAAVSEKDGLVCRSLIASIS